MLYRDRERVRAPATTDFLTTGMLRQVAGKAVVAGTQSKTEHEVQPIYMGVLKSYM